MTDPKEFPSDKADKFVVRFPDGMRNRIAEAAKANNRSMNAEIVSRLERSLSDHPAQDDPSVYKLSTIGRLETQLAAAEGQRNSLSIQALHISAALATSYPLAKSVMDADHNAKKNAAPVIEHGMRVAKAFASSYEPQGIESMLRTLEDIRQALNPAMSHLSKDQWEAFSDVFDPAADELLKKKEIQMVGNIMAVMDKYGIQDPPED